MNEINNLLTQSYSPYNDNVNKRKWNKNYEINKKFKWHPQSTCAERQADWTKEIEI